MRAEDEGKGSKPKPERKLRTAAIVTPDRTKELTQLKYQQHQMDTLAGQKKTLVAAFKSTHPPHFPKQGIAPLREEGLGKVEKMLGGEVAPREGTCPTVYAEGTPAHSNHQVCPNKKRGKPRPIS